MGEMVTVEVNAKSVQGVSRADIDRFVELANTVDSGKPKPEQVRELAALLEKGNLWRIAGDLARLTRDQIVADIKGNQSIRMSLKSGLVKLQSDLGYAQSSALERMIIDEVCLTWLNHNLYSYQHHNALQGGLSLDSAAYWDRKVTLSQRRFLRACESLARVRKLLTPSIGQVNIGQQQTNIANLKEPQGAKI